MRVVYIGAVEFSLRALRCLIDIGVNIVGVCTLKESGFNADHFDLTELCREQGIPCFYCDNINDQYSTDWISSKKPDVLFCFGWSRLLKDTVLNMAPLGVVGYHPAYLPANRGRHPLIWALVLGLRKTASTFFFMKEGADDGDILSQHEILISEDDDARSLYDKMTNTALVQIQQFVPKLAMGTYERRSQDGLQFNTWRKRSRLDGQIDWRMSALSVHNLVRALVKPYVGAHFMLNGEEVKVWKAKVVRGLAENLEPGKVVGYQNDYPVIKCGEDGICLMSTEPNVKLQVGGYL